MATTAEISNDGYEYMDENRISNELKCSICKQPFREPASLPCQHTFCLECINLWLEENASCPTCRRSFRLSLSKHRVTVRLVTTPIIVNQLNELLVRCNLCREPNIQRENFDGHEKRCPKGMTPCLAVDIRCQWTGTRDQLEEHFIQCPFERIRPIINNLQGQIDTSLLLQNGLEEKLERQSEDIDFLLTVINGGHIMHKKCIKPFNRCRYPITRPKRWSPAYQCKLCDNNIRLRSSVALHACSNKNDIDCICRKCYANQYRPAKESDEEDDDDDDDDEQ